MKEIICISLKSIFVPLNIETFAHKIIFVLVIHRLPAPDFHHSIFLNTNDDFTIFFPFHL